MAVVSPWPSFSDCQLYILQTGLEKVKVQGSYSLGGVFMFLCLFFSGWKLNPVVGTVYGPEFYAGNVWIGPGPWATVALGILAKPLILEHILISPCS